MVRLYIVLYPLDDGLSSDVFHLVLVLVPHHNDVTHRIERDVHGTIPDGLLFTSLPMLECYFRHTTSILTQNEMSITTDRGCVRCV